MTSELVNRKVYNDIREKERANERVCERERWILFCVLLFKYSEHTDQRADLRSRIILRI